MLPIHQTNVLDLSRPVNKKGRGKAALHQRPKAELLQKIEQLQAEIISLRRGLGLDQPTNLESWGAFAPQEIRDQMAASAFIAERLNPWMALRRLGFHLQLNEKNAPVHIDAKKLAALVFGTDGVRAILDRDMADANANKKAIIARLVQTSMHGTDGESTRAAQQLAKIADWNEGDKSVAREAAPKTLIQFLGAQSTVTDGVHVRASIVDPNEIVDADSFLVHEPGEAGAVIDTEEALTP